MSEDMREKLFHTKKNGYDIISVKETKAMQKYCDEYMKFLNDCRTERECVSRGIEMLEGAGFVPYNEADVTVPGTKVYWNNRGKMLTAAVIGKKSLSEGCTIVGSHIDSPRLDLKQNPMYESEELGYFKTHYYGGIKKYQWTTVPLELHGKVILKDGSDLDISIGRNPGEPKFIITDLLVHLSADQMQKTLREGIKAEQLNILIGSVPYADDGKDRVKLALLSILNENYGIVEEDFLSAELTAVPAYDVTEIGFDRSLIGGYGQDDRVCAFAALKAILDAKNPERTCVMVLSDKEEVGSGGVSGMKSWGFDAFMDDLCQAQGVQLRRCYENSFCLSADVTAALDPTFAEAHEKLNDARMNYGVSITKYTGARGKSGGNDASAELVGKMRQILDKHNVVWQATEMGKVDLGGGGTIAVYMGDRNIDTIDAGTPLFSMHSPFEIASKLDAYMTYKASYAVFMQ